MTWLTVPTMRRCSKSFLASTDSLQTPIVPIPEIMRYRLASIVLLSSFSFSTAVPAEDRNRFDIRLSYLKLRVPSDNLLTTARVKLGEQLFFDTRLSRNNTISCATCHNPAKGWSNGKRYATGIDSQVGTRSVPSLVNAGFQQHQFWDGRAGSLEEQARQPIESPVEMDMKLDALATKLNRIDGYRQQFQRAFGADASPKPITQAIASFVRTIVSGEAPYDRYRAGNLAALSPAAQRGHDIFFFRANCRACHQGPNFTDDDFHSIGIVAERSQPDVGRAAVTKDELDEGKFKTPTLRDVARSAPYMHDGRFETLEEVVDHYVDGAFMDHQHEGTIHVDELMNVFPMTDKEKADLVVFLKEGLSSYHYPEVSRPNLPE